MAVMDHVGREQGEQKKLRPGRKRTAAAADTEPLTQFIMIACYFTQITDFGSTFLDSGRRRHSAHLKAQRSEHTAGSVACAQRL